MGACRRFVRAPRLRAPRGDRALVAWAVVNAPFDVVASDSDSVTVAFTVTFEARFGAVFTLSVRDGIDRDYVMIVRTRAKSEEHFDVMIVATMDVR